MYLKRRSELDFSPMRSGIKAILEEMSRNGRNIGVVLCDQKSSVMRTIVTGKM